MTLEERSESHRSSGFHLHQLCMLVTQKDQSEPSSRTLLQRLITTHIVTTSQVAEVDIRPWTVYGAAIVPRTVKEERAGVVADASWASSPTRISQGRHQVRSEPLIRCSGIKTGGDLQDRS